MIDDNGDTPCTTLFVIFQFQEELVGGILSNRRVVLTGDEKFSGFTLLVEDL